MRKRCSVRGQLVVTVLLAPLVLFGIGSVALADMWTPDPAAALNPNKINVGGGGSHWFDDGYTITLVEGDTVKLKATSEDKDTLLLSPTGSSEYSDTAQILWEVSAGTISGDRVDSGQQVTFTAPQVPEGQTSISVTIRAKPDDDSVTDPGGPLYGHCGNRNDDHTAQNGIVLNVVVIKECPTTAAAGNGCNAAHSTIWAYGWKTGGLLCQQIQVSGGTPPNPPNNWNGIYIKEIGAVHPDDRGDATASQFDNYDPESACAATQEGFVVGLGKSTAYGCSAPATNNAFWDDHMVLAGWPVLKDGEPARTIKCRWKYYCKNTQLETNGDNDAFKVTKTYQNTTYDPDGGGPQSPYRVTQVDISWATE